MNKSNENSSSTTTKKILTQQVFHPSLFNKTRSSSLSDLTRTDLNPQQLKQGENAYATANPQQPLQGENTDLAMNNQELVRPAWQRVPTSNKRRRTSDSPPNTERLKVSNRFDTLPQDQIESSDRNLATPTPNRPPPIVLYGIEDVNELNKLLTTVCDPEQFKINIANKNLLRVLVQCPEAYKTVISKIRESGLIGHTFTPKDKKPYRIVIRKLHPTTPHQEIAEAIEATGNKICGEIINARYGADKTPTFTFFVNLERNANNKAVKDIKSIFHQQVVIEDPRKSKTIVQCQRCQQLGHTKNNCMRPYRCVKCGEGHKSADCKKDRNTPAKCALCLCDHPANYKGCQVYIEILARKTNQNTTHSLQKHVRNDNVEPNIHHNKDEPLPATTNSRPRDKGKYSDVTANRCPPDTSNQQQPNTQPRYSLEQILCKQSEKLDQLIQQIGTLLGLLTTVISKLHS